jgi:hypothetical protein
VVECGVVGDFGETASTVAVEEDEAVEIEADGDAFGNDRKALILSDSA